MGTNIHWNDESKVNEILDDSDLVQDSVDKRIFQLETTINTCTSNLHEMRRLVVRADETLKNKEKEFNDILCRISAERNILQEENRKLKEQISFLNSRKGIRLR